MDLNAACNDSTAELTALQAGPLAVSYGDGDLRCVRYAGREVIRRIYLGARDEQGDTLPVSVGRHTIEKGSRSFRLYATGSVRQGDVSLAWQLDIRGEADGMLTFRVRGRAESAFRYNRIGLCLLHPAECAGVPCRVTHTDGSVEEGQFPVDIAPHQPLMDIRSISYPAGESVWATITFEGDVFEMEDQRNAAEASFETHSMPPALPLPREMRLGQRFEQKLSLRLEGDVDLTPAGPSASRV